MVNPMETPLDIAVYKIKNAINDIVQRDVYDKKIASALIGGICSEVDSMIMSVRRAAKLYPTNNKALKGCVKNHVQTAITSTLLFKLVEDVDNESYHAQAEMIDNTTNWIVPLITETEMADDIEDVMISVVIELEEAEEEIRNG